MEVDHLTQPTSLSSVHTGDDVISMAKGDGLFTMGEFLSDYEAEHTARKAAKSAMKVPARLVAVGARSSQNIVALHMKYQALGIQQPQFTFSGSNGEGWAVEVSFLGLDVDELQGIKDERRYPSKQEAKEALSERALEILETLEKEGKVKKAEAGSARTSKYAVILHDRHQKLGIPQPHFTYSGTNELGWSAEVNFPEPEAQELQGLKDESRHSTKKDAKEALCKQIFDALEALAEKGKVRMLTRTKAQMQQQPQEKQEPGPNYVGQLLEFQRARGAPQPIYRDYSAGIRFACLIEIDGHSEPFGSLDSLHSSKKAARQEAARYAVEYFKTQGIWPEDFSDAGGIKKKKKKEKAQPGLTELVSSTSPAIPNSRKLSSASSSPGSASYAQQVAHMALTLSLGTPEWRYTTNPVDKDFQTVQCYFNGAGPHEGPIGEVRNILGKKKAKEECAHLTLDYLKGIYAHRMAYGQRMMEGISGGEGLIDAAASKPRDGEKEAMAARRLCVQDMGGDSDEEMEFEDAMEDLRT